MSFLFLIRIDSSGANDLTDDFAVLASWHETKDGGLHCEAGTSTWKGTKVKLPPQASGRAPATHVTVMALSFKFHFNFKYMRKQMSPSAL